jgi:hypothetical protein
MGQKKGNKVGVPTILKIPRSWSAKDSPSLIGIGSVKGIGGGLAGGLFAIKRNCYNGEFQFTSSLRSIVQVYFVSNLVATSHKTW